MTFTCINCREEKASTEEAKLSFVAHIGLFLASKGTSWGEAVCLGCARQVAGLGWFVVIFLVVGSALSVIVR